VEVAYRDDGKSEVRGACIGLMSAWWDVWGAECGFVGYGTGVGSEQVFKTSSTGTTARAR
jgi:hypothetical protein